MNIFHYLKKQNATFSETEVNRLDALVLSWFSYYNYPDELSDKPFIVSALNKKEILKEKKFTIEASDGPNSRKLIKRLVSHPRYQNLKLSDFVRKTDIPSTTQFAAVTIEINPRLHVIAYRGTDPSFVGWKEDFLLSYKEAIPSHDMALDYLEKATEKYEGEFILTGHSKGGNVAIFAFYKTSVENRKRIKALYSFDSPGFAYDFKDVEDYQEANDKVHKMIPKSSIIGMFFEKEPDFAIVDSSFIFIFQHDAFSWQVKGNDFKYKKRRTRQSKFIASRFNTWVESLSLEEKEKFTDLVFDLFYKTKANDFFTFLFQIPKYGPKLISLYKGLDLVDKLFLKRMVKSFQKAWLKKKIDFEN